MAIKHLFDAETEVGKCDPDVINGHFGDLCGDWIAFASTSATLTGSQGMLRIEQRCYLRSIQPPGDLRDQSWISPDMTFEPMLGSKEDTLRKIQQLHTQFVLKARQAFTDQSILTADQGVGQFAS